MTFTSSYSTAYDTTPTIANLAGFYTGQIGDSLGMQTANITVLADGTFTGTATVRTNGNVFNQSMTLGGAPCLFAGSTLQGIRHLDIPARRLYTAAPNSLRTDAAIFFGAKIL